MTDLNKKKEKELLDSIEEFEKEIEESTDMIDVLDSVEEFAEFEGKMVEFQKNGEKYKKDFFKKIQDDKLESFTIVYDTSRDKTNFSIVSKKTDSVEKLARVQFIQRLKMIAEQEEGAKKAFSMNISNCFPNPLYERGNGLPRTLSDCDELQNIIKNVSKIIKSTDKPQGYFVEYDIPFFNAFKKPIKIVEIQSLAKAMIEAGEITPTNDYKTHFRTHLYPKVMFLLGRVINIKDKYNDNQGFDRLGRKVDVMDRFLQQTSFQIQTLEKTLNCWCFLGPNGSGKGVMADEIFEVLYGDSYFKGNGHSISEKHDGWLKNKLFSVLEEVAVKKSDYDAAYSKVKNLVGDNKVGMRSMGEDFKLTENPSNFMIYSNEEGFMKVAHKERRFIIIKTCTTDLIIPVNEIYGQTVDEFIADIRKERDNFFIDLAAFKYEKSKAKSSNWMNPIQKKVISLTNTKTDNFAVMMKNNDKKGIESYLFPVTDHAGYIELRDNNGNDVKSNYRVDDICEEVEAGFITAEHVSKVITPLIREDINKRGVIGVNDFWNKTLNESKPFKIMNPNPDGEVKQTTIKIRKLPHFNSHKATEILARRKFGINTLSGLEGDMLIDDVSEFDTKTLTSDDFD